LFVMEKIVTALGKFLNLFTALPWPWLRLFLGARADGSFSFLSGMLACWVVAGITLTGAVWFSLWGAQQGLAGNFAADVGPAAPRKGSARLGKEPLYRKEFLWFIRDRSAILQTILIPLTIASVQVFNMRSLLSQAQGRVELPLWGWHFVWSLFPVDTRAQIPHLRGALWIALTWPRGLESLLKAKAWLWPMISSGIVALVLCYAAFLFPADIWKVALVGVGWFFFSRSNYPQVARADGKKFPTCECRMRSWPC
jgi:hypothetical protein